MQENNFSRAIEEALTDEYLDLIPQVENHEFSKKFQKKMSKLIKYREKPYYNRINTFGKRVACVIAICIFISTITIINIDALREKVFNFSVNIFSNYSSVQYDVQNEEYPMTIE